MTAPGNRQIDKCIWVSDLGQGARFADMHRVSLASQGEAFDEDWLQNLVHRNPAVLPIGEIEGGFGQPLSLCREMATPVGPIDNVLMTPEGNIILVECKLWRNPQARREVVGQILDYAHCLAAMGYDGFEQAVLRAWRGEGERPSSLWEAVPDSVDEAAFVDAVSRNLRLGRFLLLIVGDGIREETETLADYLQQHAGIHFTLALIEMLVHAVPGGGYVVHPRILSRTLNIERGVVRPETAGIGIGPPEPARSGASISEAQFYEGLAQIDPALPARLRAFGDDLAAHDIALVWTGKSLKFDWAAPNGAVNLGAINRAGRFDSAYAGWPCHGLGRVDIASRYHRDLADIVGGDVRQTPTEHNWYAVDDSGKPPLVSALLTQCELWLVAIQRYADAYRRAAAEVTDSA